MKIVTFPKAVEAGDKSDMTLPYVGYKKHTEETVPANTFLAFRCGATCVFLPFEKTQAKADIEATFAGDKYKVSATPSGAGNRTHMLRAVLIEDRSVPKRDLGTIILKNYYIG